MAEKNLNRIKVMLAEKGKTNKWLAEKLGRDQATISKWCTNACQPPLEALIQISQCLEVDIKELIRVPEHNPYKVCYNNRFATLACRIFTLVGTGGPAPWRWPFPDR